jgi:hypothetical protein
MKRNLIYVFQNPKSDKQQDAIFYSGIIATTLNPVGYDGKYICLTCRDAEIKVHDQKFIGQQIADLAAMNVISDEDIDQVEILVDGFFYVAYYDVVNKTIQSLEDVDDDLIFNTYDEAIKGFTEQALS